MMITISVTTVITVTTVTTVITVVIIVTMVTMARMVRMVRIVRIIPTRVTIEVVCVARVGAYHIPIVRRSTIDLVVTV
jgi:hypothetical protein